MRSRVFLSVVVMLTLFSASTASAGNPDSGQMASGAFSSAPQEMPIQGGPGIGAWPPELKLNRTRLNFGVTLAGGFTGPQTFLVSNVGGGTLNWTASYSIFRQHAGPPPTWLRVSPMSGGSGSRVTVSVDPTGLLAGTHNGCVTVSDPNAINSPAVVNVALTVHEPGVDVPPRGGFSTPFEASTVAGSVPVSGWALDDTQIESVDIYRQNGANLVPLGEATFVEGARPDVEQAYPDYPNNSRAGWGYTLHTNSLPGGGTGSLTLHAQATDSSGQTVSLGTRTISVDNANAVKPFGAIDTPSRGGEASGTSYRSSGWVLTPQPSTIPTDGSTIHVWVDGVNVGTPTYNVHRMDIAELFPGYNNSDGAGAYLDFDTTAYRNGVHTITWTATDDAGNTGTVGSQFFTINNPTYQPPGLPVIELNRGRLNFSAPVGAPPPNSQSFMVTNPGSGNLEWAASPLGPWLDLATRSGNGGAVVTVSANPTGLPAGTYHGSITVSDANASNSPTTVAVDLYVGSLPDTDPPFGSFATPLDGSTVQSSIPVTGWVLDDSGVESVKIYRQETGDLVYIGDATFVEGARPDVALAYPDYPNNYRAGWGYMMLTNFLPDGGNGTFTIQAVATDTSGNQVTLGTKTITVDNASADKPFGVIDTPTQGGTASGTNYQNVGWALTPKPNVIPTDGSTIDVYVDGVIAGQPTYNVYREDIAALFPGYANSDGAGGLFTLDTTRYANGVHTIQWTARDDAGNTDGIGSRYFNIQNPSTGHVGGAGSAAAVASTDDVFATIQEAIDKVGRGGTVYVAAGTYTESVTLDKNLFVVLSGDVDLDGDLSISAGSFIAPAGNLSLSGDLTHSAGVFDPNGGTVIFDGGGTQTIDGDTLFFNLMVGSGVELETTANVTLDGRLVNHGVTRETKTIAGTGAVTFGLATATIDVTTAGLTNLQVERRDQDHAQAPLQIQTRKYWSFTPTGTGFALNMTLPHNEVPEPNDKVCRYTGTDQVWECSADSFDTGNSTITRNGITQLSDWATWDDTPAEVVNLPLICK